MTREEKVGKKSLEESSFRKSERILNTHLEMPEGRTQPVKKAGSLTGDRK
ncbi:MAG: hypothetical protein Q7J08_03395 [Methanocorpusculum sp.]|nr:hypothetical protein [Methanocorpusculum sp.]MDO9522739.1 hypothetical protein [Methanocorpusculum sp.]